ncbi:MAG: hypothetical protein ABI678_10700 [Kofleriaceae bacterium]
MAVHIDKIESEIEMVSSPEAGRQQQPAFVQTGVPAPGALRDSVKRALEDELGEYLRIRG